MRSARPEQNGANEVAELQREVARLSVELASANALIEADSALRATLFCQLRDANEQLLLNSLRAESEQQASAVELLRSIRRTNGDFLASLTHEFQQPVAALARAMESVRKRLNVAESTEWDVAEQSVVHLRRLVDTLLDAARVYRGRVRLKRGWITFSEAVSKASAASASEFDRRGHLLETSLEEDDLMVYADPERLHQVLSHLLDNAARYTPDGGFVRLSVRRDSHEILVEITDNGVGITAGLKKKLFGLFVQGDRYPRERGLGLGVGLATVRGLAELHGGTIAVLSGGRGTGSTFLLRLPGVGPR